MKDSWMALELLLEVDHFASALEILAREDFPPRIFQGVQALLTRWQQTSTPELYLLHNRLGKKIEDLQAACEKKTRELQDLLGKLSRDLPPSQSTLDSIERLIPPEKRASLSPRAPSLASSSLESHCKEWSQSIENYLIDLHQAQRLLKKLLSGGDLPHPLSRLHPGMVEVLLLLSHSHSGWAEKGICETLTTSPASPSISHQIREESLHQISLARTCLRIWLERKRPGGPELQEELKKLKDLDLHWLKGEIQLSEISGESLGLAVFFAFYSDLFSLPFPPHAALTGKLEIPPHQSHSELSDNFFSQVKIQPVGGVAEKVKALFWNRPWIKKVLLPPGSLAVIEREITERQPGWGLYLKEGHLVALDENDPGLELVEVENLKEALGEIWEEDWREGARGKGTARLPAKKFFRTSLIAPLLLGLLIGLWFYFIEGTSAPPSPLGLVIDGEKRDLTGDLISLQSGEKIIGLDYPSRGQVMVFSRQAGQITPLVDYWQTAKRPRPDLALPAASLSRDQDWFFLVQPHSLTLEEKKKIISFLHRSPSSLAAKISGAKKEIFAQSDLPKGEVRWNLILLDPSLQRGRYLGGLKIRHTEVQLSSEGTRLAPNGQLHYLSHRQKLQIKAPHKGYFYVFSRQKGKVSLLEGYCRSPRDKQNHFTVNLADLENRSEWFFLSESKKISPQKLARWKNTLLAYPSLRARSRGIKDFPGDESPLIYWKLYTGQGYLLKELAIYRQPLSMEVLAQKRDSDDFFLVKDSTSLTEGDRIQLRLGAYETVYGAVFMRDSTGKIQKLWPPRGKGKLKGGEVRLVPSARGWKLDKKKGLERFFSFYGKKEFDRDKLIRWIRERKTGEFSSVEEVEKKEVFCLVKEIRHQ